MQVNVIPVDSLESFDYFIYPEQNPYNQSYFHSQVYQVNQALNAFGQKFMEASRQIYEKINDWQAIKAAKAALRYAVGLAHPNAITKLKTLDEVRAAQPVMQRYIMANPVVREFYQKQRIDGFSDTYLDNEPGKIGSRHYDYRRVTDGIVQDTQTEEGDYEWVSHQYFEDLFDGDRDLELVEKVDILHTWDIIEMFMKAGQADPTNPFGGEVA